MAVLTAMSSLIGMGVSPEVMWRSAPSHRDQRRFNGLGGSGLRLGYKIHAENLLVEIDVFLHKDVSRKSMYEVFAVLREEDAGLSVVALILFGLNIFRICFHN